MNGLGKILFFPVKVIYSPLGRKDKSRRETRLQSKNKIH